MVDMAATIRISTAITPIISKLVTTTTVVTSTSPARTTTEGLLNFSPTLFFFQ